MLFKNSKASTEQCDTHINGPQIPAAHWSGCRLPLHAFKWHIRTTTQTQKGTNFVKLQLTLTAENCSEAHFTRTFYKIHPETCTLALTSQRTETHTVGTSSLPYTRTHSGHLSSGKYLPQGQTWQGIPMRLSVISATSAPFCSLFLEMTLEPQMTKAMIQ